MTTVPLRGETWEEPTLYATQPESVTSARRPSKTIQSGVAMEKERGQL